MSRRTFGISTLLLLTGAPAFAATIDVATSGFSFSPANVTIEVGDTVAWTIAVTHNVVQTDGPGSCTMEPGGFLSGSSELDTSTRSFEHTFNATGTFYYKCNPHCASGMRGTVTVVAADDGGPEDDGGSANDGGPMGDPASGDDDTTSGGDASGSTNPPPSGDDEGGCSAVGAGSSLVFSGPVLLLARARRRR